MKIPLKIEKKLFDSLLSLELRLFFTDQSFTLLYQWKTSITMIQVQWNQRVVCEDCLRTDRFAFNCDWIINGVCSKLICFSVFSVLNLFFFICFSLWPQRENTHTRKYFFLNKSLRMNIEPTKIAQILRRRIQHEKNSFFCFLWKQWLWENADTSTTKSWIRDWPFE